MHLPVLWPHRRWAGSVGTQTSCCGVNTSFLLHLCTCACLLPPGTDGKRWVPGTHPLCYGGAACSRGIGGGVKKRTCDGKDDSVGATAIAHPVGTCLYARTKQLAPRSPQKSVAEARVEPVSTEPPALTTELPFHARQLLMSIFLKHQQCVHSS